MFYENMDMKIFKCVKFYWAHSAAHWNKKQLFESTVYMWRREHGMGITDYQLSWKTLYYRFNRMMSEREEANTTNAPT